MINKKPIYFSFVFVLALLFVLMNRTFAQEKLDTINKTVNASGWTFNGVYDKFS